MRFLRRERHAQVSALARCWCSTGLGRAPGRALRLGWVAGQQEAGIVLCSRSRVAHSQRVRSRARLQSTVYLLFENSTGYALFEQVEVDEIAMQLEAVSRACGGFAAAQPQPRPQAATATVTAQNVTVACT